MIASSHMVMGSLTERVILDIPAATAVREEAERAGARRVVVMANKTLAERTDEITSIVAALGDRYAATLPAISAHSPKREIVAATAAAIEAGADLIVAVGGSSIMDAAKVLSLAHGSRATTLQQLDELRMLYDTMGQRISSQTRGPDIRVVCVPTTLSGGEFNTLSGAYDEATGSKHGFEHPAMAPVAIVLDPDIARHTPPELWLATGMRAVDHAIETLVSCHSNAYYDGLAESGLRLLVEALPRVKNDPNDRVARHLSQIGAWQAILPLVGGVPMGASHAIGHALGAACGISHGETSCVMAAAVQRWNAQQPCAAQERVAKAFGNGNIPLDVTIDDFVRGLGLPHSLADVGVGEEHYARLAELTLQDIWGGTNVRPLRGPEDVIEILREARG